MSNFCQIFVFLVCLTERARLTKTDDVQYEMHCDCGKRLPDQLSELDCEESARLEAQQQAEFSSDLSFHFIISI